MIFQYYSKELLSDLELHDAEISEIIVNYNNHTVSIPLRLKSRTKALIMFENVRYSDISIVEPWGKGIYIYEVTVNDSKRVLEMKKDEKIKDDCFNTTLLLNSGDNINIISSKVNYTIDNSGI